jgi:uncharacterized caspase-like protein
MTKVALLVGVSEYQPGLASLPSAIRDVAAMQQVLQHSHMGGFDEVITLLNPAYPEMQEAIESLFSGRKRDDLTLLFFSGHGIKDDQGRLYFATRSTRKQPNGELIRATAVNTSFVQDTMSHSRSRRQVVILDCCFSGAFAEGMTAKDDGSVDVQAQLGGEGRAVMTSSTSTQYSFEQQGSTLSVYTSYVVEGLETGAADTNNDGLISVDELHEYARKKVQEAAPAMKPKLYATEEGFKIHLAQAPTADPKLIYRKAIEQFAGQGQISEIGRETLAIRQRNLQLSTEEAMAIEAAVLQPYQIYQENLGQYTQVLEKVIRQQRLLSETTQRELRSLQTALGLRDEDVEAIAHRLTSKQLRFPNLLSQLQQIPWYLAGIGAGLLLLVLLVLLKISFGQKVVQRPELPISTPVVPSSTILPTATPSDPGSTQKSSPSSLEQAPSGTTSASTSTPISTPVPTSTLNPVPALTPTPTPALAPTLTPTPSPSPAPPPRLPVRIVPTSDAEGRIQGYAIGEEEIIDASYLMSVRAGQRLSVKIEFGAVRFDVCPRLDQPGSCIALNISEALDEEIPRTGQYRISVLAKEPTNFTLSVQLDGVTHVVPPASQ